LVSPLSFPHLWKKLWKLAENSRVVANTADFVGISAVAKARKRRKIALLEERLRGNA
jgi:hypothetical protein